MAVEGKEASTTNLAAWLTKVNTLEVLQYDEGFKPLNANEVRVAMKAVGICGSDVHYLKHMRIAHFVVESPMVIGHESSGVITEVGPGVSHLQVGDRVALEPGVPCRVCAHCKTGHYNLCPDMRFFATPPVHGSLAQHVVHPADLAFKIPDNVSLEEGAMCEPLSVAVHACRRANVQPGQKVLVTGAGPIGLVTLLVAKAYGACHVTLTDVSDERLAMAARLGATHVLNVHGKTVEAIKALLPWAPDISIDCAGFTDTVSLCMEATISGGKVCLVGLGCSGAMEVPLMATTLREVDLVGVFRYRNTYPTCLELLASKRVDVRPLITHRYDCQGEEKFCADTISRAFEVSAKGGEAIKVMFNL